jgi:hypothetical protein
VSHLLQGGTEVKLEGTYVEVGHGGAPVKDAQRIEAKQGDKLPEFKTYQVKIEYKGEHMRDRQHKWMLV